MIRSTDKSAPQHAFVCPSCKKKSFRYGPELVPACPHAGRPGRTRSRRLALRIMGAALLLGLAAALVIAYYRGMFE